MKYFTVWPVVDSLVYLNYYICYKPRCGGVLPFAGMSQGETSVVRRSLLGFLCFLITLLPK